MKRVESGEKVTVKMFVGGPEQWWTGRGRLSTSEDCQMFDEAPSNLATRCIMYPLI